MFKKFLTASVIYSIGPQLPKIAGFLLLPILTPYLTNVDFGVWGTIMAYVLLFSAARDMGLNAPMVNVFYQHQNRWKWVWRQLSSFLFLFGFGYTAIQLLVIWLVIPKEAISNRPTILLLIGLQSLLFDVPNQIGFRYLQLKEKPVLLSIISIISGFIAIAVQLYVVIVLKQGYMGWFFATFASTLFSSIIYIVIIYTNKLLPIFTIRIKWLKPRIALALPMLPHNYSAYLLNASDRMVMNVNNINTQNIGLYNVAYMWGSYLEVFGNAIGMAVGPAYMKLFTENSVEGERKIYHLTQFLQFVFVIGPFIIALWSKELFQIFIKSASLKQAYGLSIIILMSYSYRPLYWNIVSRLQFNNLTKQLWKISLVGGLLNLILNLIFIPIYGYKVAAITTFAALMYLGFSGFMLKAYKNLDKNDYFPFRWLIAIIVLTILAYYLKDISINFKFFISLSLIAVSFNSIYKRHIKFLKNM